MRTRRRAFTMIELMMVVTIMGLIAALILRAAVGGIKRAEEKATIALIAKLEAALTDRIDALANEHPEPTGSVVQNGSTWVVQQQGHASLAAVTNSSGVIIPSPARAQVIAYYDNLRAELPDVFIVQNVAPTAVSGVYPLNFGAATIPGTSDQAPQNPMPLGVRLPIGANDGNTSLPNPIATTGMWGASFAAAGGIYQQLGYAPQGYDGNDNNGDGFIDDALEGLTGLDPTQVAQIQKRLISHKHNTARAEMLYAILCFGTGPMGSSFSPDDFSKNEVADTDNDGLMEFVDAWGQPLQFYRWPIMYNSDTQRGFPTTAIIGACQTHSAPIGPYVSAYESREANTLDPNQLLLAPAWWTNTYNSNASTTVGVSGDSVSNASGSAIAFQSFFHTLIDPLAAQAGGSGVVSGTIYSSYWDRSAAPNTIYGKVYSRRAYYNRFLVLSGGPDKNPGTAMLGVNYQSYTTGGIDERSTFPLANGSFATTRDLTGAAVQVNIANVVQIENQAGRIDPNRSGAFNAPTLNSGRNDTNTFLEDAGNDDITSQNIHALGGPLE